MASEKEKEPKEPPPPRPQEEDYLKNHIPRKPPRDRD